MTQIIRASEDKIMPWKNGLGSTAEIEIFPAQSNFAENKFDYRLSSAKVASPGPFSRFPGFDRLLCVIEGEAIRINGERHEAFAPFAFSGEEEVYAALFGSEILDLGIIFRRDLFKAEMKVFELKSGESEISLELAEGIHFIFCAEGNLELDGQLLNRGDTFKTESTESEIKMKSTSAARGIHICLIRK